MDHLPQQHDGWVLARVAVVVLRDTLERLEIEHGRTADEQLKLLPPEELQTIAATHRLEPAHESAKLPRDRILEQIFDVQPHVLVPVVAGDRYVPSPRHQIVRAPLAKLLIAHLHAKAKSGLHLGHFIVEQLLHRTAHAGKSELEISQTEILAHQLLVDHMRKANVKNDTIVDGDAEEDADELELALVLEGGAVEPINAKVLVVCEHAVVDIEDLRHDELEKLLLNAAFIDALLSNKLHFEWLLQILLAQRHLQQRVGDEVRAPHLDHEVRRGCTDKQGAQDGTLELVRHLRGGIVHEHATLRRRLKDERVLTEGELAALALPPAIILAEVHFLVDRVVVEGMVVERMARAPPPTPQRNLIRLVQLAENLGPRLHRIINPLRMVQPNSDKLLTHAHHLLQLLSRQKRPPLHELRGAQVRKHRDK
mmetsp:Transcript_5072/g.11568  ORF Transcript_5072/g.11568 Transcript_5072/m.11568 type:complete len:424 (-) Transcript_5072:802-2073(-)